VGRSIGVAYAINTIGAVLGSFCAGFVLIPLFGKENSLGLVIGLQLLTSLVVGGIILVRKEKSILKLVPLAAPALAGLFLCFYFPVWNHLLLSKGKYHRFEEIKVNVKSYGWLEAFLHGPEILTRAERNELVYYGDGIGGFTTVLKHVDPLGSIKYSMANSGKIDASSWGDMKSQTVWAENRLNEDGIFCQWLHSYQMDWPTFALVGRTFAQIFPNSLLLLTEPSKAGIDYMLIGFKGKDRLVLENAERKLSCIQQSKNVALSDPKLLYRLIVSEDLQGLFGPGPVNTDSWPQLEFAAPKLMYHSDPMIRGNIQSEKWLTPETGNIVQQVITDVDAQIDFVAYALSLYEPFRNMVDLSKATTLQKERFFKLMEVYCADNSVDFAIFKNDELKQRCRSVQIEAIQSRIALMPDKAASYFYLADLYYEKGMLDEAIANYSKLLQINPDSVEGHSNLGTALTKQGRLDEAITHFTEAIQIDPYNAEVHGNLGTVLTKQGRVDEATKHLIESLRIKPGSAEIHYNLGYVLARQGKLDEAIAHFTESLRIEPDNAEAHNNLGGILARRGKLDEAVTHYTEALRIKPDSADAHSNLGYALTRQGRLGEAATHYTEALRIKPDSADTHYNFGVALARQGKLDEAITHFAEALRIRPNFTAAQKGLEKALLLRKNRDRK